MVIKMKYAVNDKRELLLCPFDDILEGYTEITKEEYEELSKPSLDTIKGNKHSELKSTMQAKRQSLKVDYDDDQFDANETAQANMIVLLKSFDLGAKEVSIRSATEKTHSFNQTQCNELALLIVSAVNNLYGEYWALKDKLDICITKEEVDSVVWN